MAAAAASDGPFEGPDWISFNRAVAAALSACDRLMALADLSADSPAPIMEAHLREIDGLARRWILRLDEVLAAAGQPRVADAHQAGTLPGADRLRRSATDVLKAVRIEAEGPSPSAQALFTRLARIANRLSRIEADLERLEEAMAAQDRRPSEGLDEA